MTDEDFCLEHGRDFMRSDKGPIPYCKACDDQFSCDTTPCVHKAMTGERCKVIPSTARAALAWRGLITFKFLGKATARPPKSIAVCIGAYPRKVARNRALSATNVVNFIRGF